MSTEAKVGIFVMISFVILAVTIYFVRSSQIVKGQVAFKTYFHDAGGLDADASVMFGGMRVGQIKSVRPDAEDPTRIEVMFQVTAETPMNARSMARVGTVTIMGSPALLITTGGNDAPRLKAGDVVPSEEAVNAAEITRRVATVTESANAVLVELRDEIPRVTTELRAVLVNVKTMTGPQNQQQIRDALGHANALLKNADGFVNSAKPLVANVDRTVTNLDRTVTNVSGTVDAVRGPLVDNLTALRKTVDDARGLLAAAQGMVGSNQEDFAETMRALRTTAENLRTLSEQLKQRPWNLVRTTQAEDRKVPR